MSNLTKSSFSDLQIATVADMQQLSVVLAESGFFSDAKSAAQCFVKILAGKELGLPAFSSMTGIHIVQGKPVIGANLMAAKIKSSGKYNYRVKTLTGELCEIEFFEGADSIGVSSFSRTDAIAAKTQNLEKFGKNMLFARAISNGCKFYCPDVFLGAPVYVPGELGEELIEAEEVNIEVVPEGNPKAIAYVYAIAAENGWTEDARDAMLETHGYNATNIITKKHVDECAALLRQSADL